jgi:glycine cleavage system protein P-like pyridoxal-binding family
MGQLGSVHPFVPVDQAGGYQEMIRELEKDLQKLQVLQELLFSQIPELRENMQD